MKKQIPWRWRKALAMLLTLTMLLCTPLGAAGAYAMEGESASGNAAPTLEESAPVDSGKTPIEEEAQLNIATPSETIAAAVYSGSVSVTSETGLRDAIRDASDGDIISIDEDITLTGGLTIEHNVVLTSQDKLLHMGSNGINIPAGKELTLNGHLGVSGSSGSSGNPLIYVSGAFTLTGDATLEQTGMSAAIYNSGTTTIAQNAAVDSYFIGINNADGGQLIVTAGTIQALGANAQSTILNFGNLRVDGGSIGSIDSGKYGISANGGTVQITDGIVYAVSVSSTAKLDVQGGTFTAGDASADVLSCNGEATLYGGGFTTGRISTYDSGKIHIYLSGLNSKGISLASGVFYNDNGVPRSFLTALPVIPSNVTVGQPSTISVDGANAGVTFTAGSSDSELGVTATNTPATGSGSTAVGSMTPITDGIYDLVLIAAGTGDATGQSLKLTLPVTVNADAANVCKIGTTGYASLGEALTAVKSGETIKLLKNINHTDPIEVDGKTINFDLGNYDLLLDTSTNSIFTSALKVVNGGKVNLIGTGTGKFNLKGSFGGVSIIGVSEATVDNVEVTENDNGVYMYGSGNALDGGKITVRGNITALQGTGVAVNAKDGKITVGGSITAGITGVYTAANYGTEIKVGGSIAVNNLTQYEATGILANPLTTVTVTGDVTVRGNNCTGVDAYGANVTVGGNMASDGAGVKAVKSTAYGKSTVIISGSLTAGTPFVTVGTTVMTAAQGQKDPSGSPITYTDLVNTVQIGSVGNPVPTVDSVTVTPATASVQKGGTKAFSAAVNGTNYPAQTVTWSVYGNNSGGTSINSSGVLTVAANETAATLTITSTSTVNTAKSGTATVTVTTVPVIEYSITVQSGGNGMAVAAVVYAAQGAEITLTATPDSGYRFKEWQVVNGGVSVVNNKFTMPAANVVVKAMFEPIPAVSYSVTFNLNGGTRTGGGELIQTIASGGSATAPTVTRSNYTFTGWDKAFANVTQNLTVIATWSYNGGGGSSSGGGSYTPEPPKPAIPIDKQPNMPAIAKMNVAGTVKDSNLSTSITEQMAREAIKAAQDAAKKSGKEVDGIAVAFCITNSGSYTSLNATIDAGAIDRMKEAGVKFINIGSAVLDVTIDTGAIAEIDKQSSGIVTVSARVQTKISKAAKALIGSRPVFNITVGYQKNGKTVHITNFGKGAVTLGIAYTPHTGGKTDSSYGIGDTPYQEQSGYLYAVYVDKKGKPQLLTNSSYNNGRMIFSRNSLSIYGVGYKAPVPVFTDTAKHWAKDNIDFVVSRDLISGTGNTAFAPDTAITRATFLMALGKLSGADVSGYKASSFTDVKAAEPAMSYIEWAVENKIVQGIGNNKFGPDQKITREEMAVMMVNYAKATGYALPVSRQTVTFVDNEKISAWAKDAVKAIQQTGIIVGKTGNLFDPQGNTTRGEASTILRRFVELVIDEGTARGWVQNDSGQWQYIDENGKAITGWLTAENIKYYFTSDGIMASGKWLEIEGNWHYFYTDGSLAKSAKIDEFEVDENGVRKTK